MSDETKKSEETKTTVNAMPKAVKLGFDMPDIKEFLKSGAQFGHQSKRWNPKMEKYIFTKRGDIHIIDLSQTLPLLEDALKFLVSASSKGDVLFVATKRQAAEIVKKVALDSNSHYIVHRWPGGFFTNHDMIRRSLNKLIKLEKEFEEGVEGRTKYEVSMLKKDWQRLNRLYEGVKTIKEMPKAIVVVDPNFERKAIREARQLGIPVVAIVDTNCDPDGIQFPIPANDDAIQSLELILSTLGKAVLQGNEGKGVKHSLKDYAKAEVKLIKKIEETEEDEIVSSSVSTPTQETPKKIRVKAAVKPTKKASTEDKGGMLGKSRANTQKVKIKKTSDK